MGRKILDLEGKKFNRLLAIEIVDKIQLNMVWRCRCDCGNITYVYASRLKNGHVKSCGCLIRDKMREIRTLPIGEANSHKLYNKYRSSSRKRNIGFSLTKEEFKNITSQSCFYCGIKPNQIISYPTLNGAYIYNGIDRVDNTKGYILDNCVPCCKICNRAKDVMSKQDFISWVKSVYAHLDL